MSVMFNSARFAPFPRNLAVMPRFSADSTPYTNYTPKELHSLGQNQLLMEDQTGLGYPVLRIVTGHNKLGPVIEFLNIEELVTLGEKWHTTRKQMEQTGIDPDPRPSILRGIADRVLFREKKSGLQAAFDLLLAGCQQMEAETGRREAHEAAQRSAGLN